MTLPTAFETGIIRTIVRAVARLKLIRRNGYNKFVTVSASTPSPSGGIDEVAWSTAVQQLDAAFCRLAKNLCPEDTSPQSRQNLISARIDTVSHVLSSPIGHSSGKKAGFGLDWFEFWCVNFIELPSNSENTWCRIACRLRL